MYLIAMSGGHDYADTLERRPANLAQRVLGRPGSLTPRAAAKLARRERDDAFRAAAHAPSAPRTCRDCAGGVMPAGVLNFSTALTEVTDDVYLHTSPAACWFFTRSRRRSLRARIRSLLKHFR